MGFKGGAVPGMKRKREKVLNGYVERNVVVVERWGRLS